MAMAIILGHEVRGVTLDPPVSDIAFTAPVDEGDIEKALEALAILYAGALADGHPHLEGIARALGDEDGDEGMAVSIAMATVPSHHVRSLLEAGRERARAMIERPDFGELHERIADALLARGSLDAADITDLRKEMSNGNQKT